MKRLNFYIIISLVSIAIAIIGIVNSTDGSVSFVWQRFDYFMDLYNTVFHSKKEELYTVLGNIYPPFLMVLLKNTAGLITPSAKNSVELREFSTPLSFAIVIASFFSITYPIISKKSDFKLSLIESLTIAIQLFTLPFFLMALDRLNPIIFYFIILFPLIVALDEIHLNFKRKIRVIIWISTFFKPYFLFPTLIIEILFTKTLKHSLKQILYLMSLYAIINMIPFLYVYHGNIIIWINNIFHFNTSTQESNSSHFNAFYYSLSPQAVLDIYPFTNFQDFSTFKTQWHNLYQILGKIISFILTIELIRRLIILISLYRSKSNFPLREKGNEFQISLNLSLFLIFLIPLMIMLLWIPSIGFYAGILLIIPICLGYLFGNKRNRLTIHFSLIGLSAIGASYPAFFSPSFAFCILTWCFVFYSMNIVMHYISEHCLNQGQAQSNSIQLQ